MADTKDEDLAGEAAVVSARNPGRHLGPSWETFKAQEGSVGFDVVTPQPRKDDVQK